MKILASFVIGLFAPLLSIAQTVVVDDLPSVTVGTGPSWTRGDAHASSLDVTVGVRIGTTPVYEWSEVSTPIAKVSAGSEPLPSTVTTGVAYRFAKSSSGVISAWGIGQAGFNANAGSFSLAATGSAALAIKLFKSNVSLVVYAKLAKPQRGVDGALVGGILQPGLQIVYGFK